MPVLTEQRLGEAVEALRAKGVRFPVRYPPANLDPGKPHFRRVWAEVETLVLLSSVINPKLLELAVPDDGGATVTSSFTSRLHTDCKSRDLLP